MEWSTQPKAAEMSSCPSSVSIRSFCQTRHVASLLACFRRTIFPIRWLESWKNIFIAIDTAIYGSEGWTLRSREEKYIVAFEMWCYRRLSRISWTQHKTKEWILCKLKVDRELLDDVKSLKLGFYGHTTRKYESLEKEIVQGCVPGYRNRGRHCNAGVGQMPSLTGLRWRSMKWVQHRKIVITGEGYYVPPTLLMEEGTERRWRLVDGKIIGERISNSYFIPLCIDSRLDIRLFGKLLEIGVDKMPLSQKPSWPRQRCRARGKLVKH